MLSFTRKNGQYQQDGQLTQSPPAASQFNFNRIGNQQTGNANRSQLTYYYGADSQRQPSNWQTSAVPHHAVFLQQTAVINNCQQRSPTNGQTGNLRLHVITGQTSFIQNPPNVMLAKEVNPQQVNSENWNKSVGVNGKPSITTRNGNIVSDRHNCWNENKFFLNPNTKSVLPVFTTATSPQHGPVAYDGTLGPAAAHHGPTVHDGPKQNHTQHCYDPPSHCSVYNNKATYSSSSGHNLQVSSTSRICQQSSPHNRVETAGGINSINRQHETNFFVSKPNTHPFNPAAKQEELKRQTIARIEDYLRTPIAAGSDGQPQVNISSAYGQKTNVPPVTSTVANIFNAKASLAIQQNFRHPLPQTTHSVMAVQHCKAVRLEQNSVPNVSVTQDGNHCEMLSAKINDRSSHFSPGRTRVVAVVQPLSQGSYQVASQQCSSNTVKQWSEGAAADGSSPDHALISPQKQLGCLKVGRSLLPVNPNQIFSSSLDAILNSTVFNNGTFGLSSSAGPQHLQQKQSTIAAGSELDVDTQVHKGDAQTAQKSVTSKAPMGQHCDMDLSETTNKIKSVVELSTVQKAPGATIKLSKYIQDCEAAQLKEIDFTTYDPIQKILHLFWDNDESKLICALKNGLYSTLMNDVKNFFYEDADATKECLSQVWGSSPVVTELKNYHVLKDTDVYKELPYKSLWLNVNEQLDDIDKEFDFPQSLKYHLHTVASVSQPGGIEKEGNIPAQAVNEVSNQMLSSTELQLVELNEEKQDPSVETSSTHTAAPVKDSTDSSDPYSFQIKVLNPEDAKVLFKQLMADPLESMDLDYLPDTVLNSSMEVELPDSIDLTKSDPKLKEKTFRPIEVICCLDRWLENILGSSTASLSKCKCKNEQSQKELTAETIDKERMAAEGNDSFSPAAAGENQAVSGESVNNRVITFDWPVIVDVFSENVGIPEDHDKPRSHSDQDPEVQLTKSDQSNSSDGEETTRISRIVEIPSDSEVEFLPYELENTENIQSSTLIESKLKIRKILSKSKSDSAIHTTDLKGNCGQAQAPSSNETQSSSETEETKSAVVARLKPPSAKLKRPRGADRFSPASKKCKSLVNGNSQPSHDDASKRPKVCFHASDGEPSPLSRPIVDLVLFGSTTQDRCGVIDRRKNHTSSPETGSNAVPTAPKCLTVTLSPLKKKIIKTVRSESSVKRHYKIWEMGFSPAKIKHKLKAQKGTFASSSKTGPADTDQLPVFPTKRLLTVKTKPSRNLRWRKSVSEELKCEEKKKKKKKTRMLNHPDGQKRNNSGRVAVKSLQSNSILKYSVLPVSFDFGSNGIKETMDSVPGKANVVEGKDHRPNQTVIARSTWYPMAHKNSPFTAPEPNTTSLFQTFKKKYMEMVKPLGDK